MVLEVVRGKNGIRAASYISNKGNVELVVYGETNFFDSTNEMKGTTGLKSERLPVPAIPGTGGWNLIGDAPKDLVSGFALGQGYVETKIWLDPDISKTPYKTKQENFVIIEEAAEVPPVGSRFGIVSLFPTEGQKLNFNTLYDFRFRVTNPYDKKYLIYVGMSTIAPSDISPGKRVVDYEPKYLSANAKSSVEDGWYYVMFLPGWPSGTWRARFSVWRVMPGPGVGEENRIGDISVNFVL